MFWVKFCPVREHHVPVPRKSNHSLALRISSMPSMDSMPQHSMHTWMQSLCTAACVATIVFSARILVSKGKATNKAHAHSPDACTNAHASWTISFSLVCCFLFPGKAFAEETPKETRFTCKKGTQAASAYRLCESADMMPAKESDMCQHLHNLVRT